MIFHKVTRNIFLDIFCLNATELFDSEQDSKLINNNKYCLDTFFSLFLKVVGNYLFCSLPMYYLIVCPNGLANVAATSNTDLADVEASKSKPWEGK